MMNTERAKNILGRMAEVPVSVKKTIALRFVAVSVFSPYIPQRVTGEGKGDLLPESGRGELLFKPVGPIGQELLSFLPGQGAVANLSLKILPFECSPDEGLGRGRGRDHTENKQEKCHDETGMA